MGDGEYEDFKFEMIRQVAVQPSFNENEFEEAKKKREVLAGMVVKDFQDAYARLTAAGAAVEVRGGEELGRVLGTTLAPDRAAEMAAAAWAACSEGAEVTDTVLAAIGDLLDRRRDAAALAG